MIQLNKNYRIQQKPLNLVLEERFKSAIGEEKWFIVGYYSNLQQLKMAIVNRKINDVVGDFTKLKETHDELLEILRVSK